MGEHFSLLHRIAETLPDPQVEHLLGHFRTFAIERMKEIVRILTLKGIRTGYPWNTGTAVTEWLRCCATNQKVAGSIPAGVIYIKSFRSYYGPGVDSSSNRNEYQEHFQGVKAAGA